MSNSNNEQIPSLCSCTAQQVTKYLLHSRFQGDGTETAAFLLEAVEAIPNIDEINKTLIQEQEESAATACDLGSIVNIIGSTTSSSSAVVSATAPRSKLTLEMYEKGCVFTNKNKDQISISCDIVKHVLMFPKREDCLNFPKRSKSLTGEVNIPGSMVLIVLKDEVLYKGKSLLQICFQLPSHQSDPIMVSNPQDLSHSELRDLIVDGIEDGWKDTLQSSLDIKVTRIYNPKFQKISDSSTSFQSYQGDGNTSITQAGMPFIKCYSGINDGVLHLLEEGLLFFKPPKFIHRSELHLISCGRGSGGRFIDLVATLNSDESSSSEEKESSEGKETVEFTNIDREEAQGLNGYIHDILVKAMQKDVEEEEKMEKDAEAKEIKDENDLEDNVDVDGESRKRKSQRSASLHARKNTKLELQSTAPDTKSDEDGDGDEDDDEDDDDFEETGSEGDSDTISEDNDGSSNDEGTDTETN